MNNQSVNFDEALKQLQSGKNLLGTDGIPIPLIKQLTEVALQAEIEHYLSTTSINTRKNGYTRKTVESTSGQFELKTPRDSRQRSPAMHGTSNSQQPAFMADLEPVYRGVDTKVAAELAIDELETKWGEKYPIVL